MGQGLPLSPFLTTGSLLGLFKWIFETEEASVSAPEVVPDPLVPPAPEPLVPVVPPVPDPEVDDAARVVGAVVPEPVVDGARVVAAVLPEPMVEGGTVESDPADVDGGVETAVDGAAVDAGVEDKGEDIGEEETVEGGDAGDAGEMPGFF